MMQNFDTQLVFQNIEGNIDIGNYLICQTVIFKYQT